MQRKENLLLFVPDEIWFIILNYLSGKNKFLMRSVNKKFQDLIESENAWKNLDENTIKRFFTSNPSGIKKVNVPALINANLIHDYQTKLKYMIPKSEYVQLMEDLVEIDKSIPLSTKTCDELEVIVESYKAYWVKTEAAQSNTPSYALVNGVCMALFLCTSLWLLLLVVPFNTPADIALKSICSEIIPGYADCLNEINDALRNSLAAYLTLGGSFGFLIKMLEYCIDKIQEAHFSTELPTPNSVLTPTVNDWCRSFFRRAFQYRNSLTFSTGLVLSATLAMLNPLKFNIKDYEYDDSSDPGFPQIDQNRLSADISKKYNMIMGLSITDGFLLMYGFIHFCVLAFKCSKKLAGECHRFYTNSKDNKLNADLINEQSQLISPIRYN